MTALIEASGLHTYYGASHVLHGIDLRVNAGESIGLLGRNGMGKTTLIRTVMGHLPAREGKIVIRGQDRSEEHTSELQSLMRISYAVFCLKKKNNQNELNEPLCLNDTKTTHQN